MMLEKKQVLPNGYFKTPSTKIDFKKYNLRVPVDVEDMVAHDAEQGLIASISSYGFGGKRIILHLICWSLISQVKVPAGTRCYVSTRAVQPNPMPIPCNVVLFCSL